MKEVEPQSSTKTLYRVRLARKVHCCCRLHSTADRIILKRFRRLGDVQGGREVLTPVDVVMQRLEECDDLNLLLILVLPCLSFVCFDFSPVWRTISDHLIRTNQGGRRRMSCIRRCKDCSGTPHTAMLRNARSLQYYQPAMQRQCRAASQDRLPRSGQTAEL